VPITIAERFTMSAGEALRAAIIDAGGNEVFCLGVLDRDGRVESLRVLARGNRQAVPALLQIPRPGEVVIHNHPSGTLTPSQPDLDVASALGNQGVGAYIVDNAVTALYVVVEPHRARQTVALDVIRIRSALAPGGAVSGALSSYEHRPQQLQMMEAVATAFNDQQVLTVEAGTGTGKSLAYLLPAIAWSLRNQERVIVSTHTINLQEQLVTKDLPLLASQAGFDCTAVLVKGRGNYLCQRKAAQVGAQGTLLVDDAEQRELQEILAWAKRTTDGSLGDLAVPPRPEVWEQVVSEHDNCLRARCPYYSSCFFYTARRAAAKADIIVVNHHLLMADLSLRNQTDSYTQNAILPPANRVIIDEAHHLEDVATSYFGSRLSYRAIERTLGRLQSPRHEARGVLPAILTALRALSRAEERIIAEQAERWITDRLLTQRAHLLAEAEACFGELLVELEKTLGRTLSGSVDEKLRVVPALRESPFWRRVEEELTRLGSAVGKMGEDLDAVCDRIEQLDEESSKQLLFLNTELRAMQGRLLGYSSEVFAFLEEDENVCRWLEVRTRRGQQSLVLNSAPIAVGPLLRAALFERFPTVVLTSATLSVDRRFDYLHRRVGVDTLSIPERAETLRVESPFDFRAQALLAVPHDIPEPTQAGYEPATHAAIREALSLTAGGTLVLFTSYGALHRAVDALAQPMRAMNLTVLRQGEANRHVLLRRFVDTPRAVLFATDSFWEGIDVPGDALRCVIISRLPFRVPTEPIEQARVEAIEQRGGNPFNEHTVPQAVIKLKQGFGRLIRTRTDRGAVVLLDSRVVNKRYGSTFLSSLPPARRVIAEWETVAAELRRFFAAPQGLASH
jgi:ATP-dependent DNA helicase DinG